MSITKVEKYKKLNMTEHKTNIKTDNNKKLNSTSKTEQKTDMNITGIDKYIKREQQFYDGTQNRIQLCSGEPNNKHIQIQQRSNNLKTPKEKG